MNFRLLIVALRGASWGIFVLAMVWPAVAMLGRCVAQGEPPDGGFTFSSRQLGLLWRSLWLAAVTTGLCLIVSLPGAFVVGRLRRLSHRPLIAALLMAMLLCPPTVYAFGWERILPATFNAYARCIGVWALWAWPIPAMIIGAGWSRIGVSAYEAALMEASPTAAFFHAVIPVLRRHVALSALILFVLYFNEYGVPHACGLLVYPTELLGWAASSTRSIDTVWPSTLSITVTALALAAMFFAWRRCAGDRDVDVTTITPAHTGGGLAAVAIGCFAVSWLLPIGMLVAGLASPGVIIEAFETYATDLIWSLCLAVLAGLAAVGMGLGLAAMRGARTLGLCWAIAFGALPGALIGEALVAGYNHASLSWVYDNWPIIALCYVSRFGWIGVLTAVLVTETTSPDLIAQARVDGATWASILGRLQIPMNWPALLCGAAVVTAMSVADVAASSLVRVPSFSPIAHVLMEKFHRFEDGMLISLSLWLVIATILPALLLMLAVRNQYRECQRAVQKPAIQR